MSDSTKQSMLGRIPEDWEVFTVEELVKDKVIAPPLDGNHGEIHPKGDDFKSSGIPFIMASDVKNGIIDFSTCKFITEHQASSLRKGFSRAGDVLLTHKASIGRTAIVPPLGKKEDYIMLTPQVTYYRVLNEEVLDNRFLKHYFDCSAFQQLISLWAGSGGTRAYIGITAQRKLPILLPLLPIQSRIADILSAYDELIDVNNKRIAILEQMAEQIYKEWFVRMRFPGHEKAKFVKGVPEGWEPDSIGRTCNLTMGQSPKSEFYNPEGIGLPFHQGVGSYGNIFPSHDTYCSVDGRKAFPGDILFSVRAPVGRINIADRELIIGRGLAAINHKGGKNTYLLHLLKNLFSREDIIGNGAIFNSVGKDELKGFKFLKPTSVLADEFESVVGPIDEEVKTLYLQNNKLTEAKNILLPRLIGGRLKLEFHEELPV